MQFRFPKEGSLQRNEIKESRTDYFLWKSLVFKKLYFLKWVGYDEGDHMPAYLYIRQKNNTSKITKIFSIIHFMIATIVRLLLN